MTTTETAPAYDLAAAPALVARMRALVDTGTTELAPSLLRVPLGYYRDPALFATEREGLLREVPLALATSAQLPAPHDYLVRQLLGTSVLVVRGEDGVARALLPYCRHRGGVVAEGCGNARRFTCPYHAWSYDAAGRLVGLPGAEGFAELDREATGLVALPCEERHGLVWVVLTAGAPIDVAAHLGPLDAELAGWDLSAGEYLTERTFTGPVNWKAAIEAFAETYHFPYVHKNSVVGQNTMANTSIFDRFGRHHRLGFACTWLPTTPDASITSALDVMVFVYWVFPNLTLAVSPIGVEVIDILPGDDPGHCVVRHGWMARAPIPDAGTREDFATLYEQVHAAVRGEDFAVLAGCGEAGARAQHDAMVIGRNEIGVHHVVRTLAAATGFALG